MLFLLDYEVFPLAASRINPATLSGCETSDAWLELSEIVVAFIRCAKIGIQSMLLYATYIIYAFCLFHGEYARK
jgi:hypothetical protein